MNRPCIGEIRVRDPPGNDPELLFYTCHLSSLYSLHLI
jgi:hypothetical protein